MKHMNYAQFPLLSHEMLSCEFFWHALSKVCQYATTNEIFYKGLKYVSINATQRDL
jgi:hypothetical protein